MRRKAQEPAAKGKPKKSPRPCRRRARARSVPSTVEVVHKCGLCVSSWGFEYPVKKIRQKKADFEAVDEILLKAIQEGIEEREAAARAARGPRTVFRLRRVSPLRRAWRIVKAFVRRLFHLDDSLG